MSGEDFHESRLPGSIVAYDSNLLAFVNLKVYWFSHSPQRMTRHTVLYLNHCMVYIPVSVDLVFE